MPDQITQDNQQPDPAAPAAAAASIAVPAEHVSRLRELVAELGAEFRRGEHAVIDELHALVSTL